MSAARWRLFLSRLQCVNYMYFVRGNSRMQMLFSLYINSYRINGFCDTHAMSKKSVAYERWEFLIDHRLPIYHRQREETRYNGDNPSSIRRKPKCGKLSPVNSSFLIDESFGSFAQCNNTWLPCSVQQFQNGSNNDKAAWGNGIVRNFSWRRISVRL